MNTAQTNYTGDVAAIVAAFVNEWQATAINHRGSCLNRYCNLLVRKAGCSYNEAYYIINSKAVFLKLTGAVR